jgi:hypothetical protein
MTKIKVLNEQIDEMIRSKYNDINYNGLNENIMAKLTNNDKKSILLTIV